MSVPRSTVAALALLTVATGVVDAVTVLGFDVFAANMTGNLVFLGFSLAGASGYSVASNAVALVSFLLGGWIAGRMTGGKLTRASATRALALQAAVLFGAACSAQRFGLVAQEDGLSGTGPWIVLGLASFAMALQNVVALKSGIESMRTTVLTLTLASLASGGKSGADRWRQVQSVLLLAVGALVGALLVLRVAMTPALLLCAILVAIAAVATRSLGWSDPQTEQLDGGQEGVGAH